MFDDTNKIMYSCNDVGNGEWKVPLWPVPNDDYWYIHNTRTGKFVKIGRVTGKGVNNFDKALAEAKRRNQIEQENN